MSLAHSRSIFPILGAKRICLENPALSCTTSYGFLASCQNFKKTNDTIPRKRTDRQKDRRTDMERWKDKRIEECIGRTDPISLDPSG